MSTQESSGLQEALFESDEHLRHMLDAADIGTWEWDLARDSVRWSANLERIVGVPAGSMGSTSEDWLALVHPEHRQGVAKGMADFIAGKGPSDLEVCIQRLDGSICWQNMRCHVVKDESGKAVYLRGITMNISARRQADDALRMQARLLETMREGVCVADEHGKIVYTNPALDRLFGYAPGELLGKSVGILNAYDLRMVAEVMTQLRERGQWRGESSNFRKDGTPFTSRLHVTALEQDGRMHAVSVQEEITQEVKARQRAAELAESLAVRERQLRSSHQAIEAERARLRTVLMDAPAAISISSGPKLDLTFMNPTFRQLIGDRQVVEHGIMGERVGAGDIRAFEHIYATGKPFRANEVRFSMEDLDGTVVERFFNLSHQPLRNAQGEVDSVVSFAVEVTEQVEARRRAETLAKEAEAANRTKDEFLAMLGHELRNPLAPILTAIELMKLRDAEYFPRERAIIERQVKYVMRLVDDLLDVSRIAQGKVSIERHRVDLAKCVFTGIELARPLITQHRHRLSVQMKEGPHVLGDPMRLAQVFANLLNNAAKYTAPGGEIEVGSKVCGDDVRVWVRDTGIGIRQEILPTVFGLFVQERQSIDRSEGGLGLGLAIVRSLVELHGGQVEAESAGRGRGSTFTVTLPLATRASEPVFIPSPPAAELRPTGRRILVVDDNADAAELLADALRYLGHTVSTAHDGRAALGMLDEFVPDLALLDIGLPGGMDGYELARRIRAHPVHGALHLIAVTGYGDGKARHAAREAGFTAHLTKPVDLSTLEGVIACKQRTLEPV